MSHCFFFFSLLLIIILCEKKAKDIEEEEQAVRTNVVVGIKTTQCLQRYKTIKNDDDKKRIF
jgi:hypothetical protein